MVLYEYYDTQQDGVWAIEEKTRKRCREDHDIVGVTQAKIMYVLDEYLLVDKFVARSAGVDQAKISSGVHVLTAARSAESRVFLETFGKRDLLLALPDVGGRDAFLVADMCDEMSYERLRLVQRNDYAVELLDGRAIGRDAARGLVRHLDVVLDKIDLRQRAYPISNMAACCNRMSLKLALYSWGNPCRTFSDSS